MNEKTNKTGATSGQNVPKSKFRHKSQQEQTAASKLRMEKRGEKLEKAKEKLAKQKPPKPPGPVRRVAGTVGGGVHGYVHGKLFEVEQENVGTEGAHRSELVGESALRHGKRFVQKKIREHPAKAVRKAESRHIKATADYHYRMAAQEHPEMQGNALSRLIQKQKIKRQYAKQAREAAKQGAKAAEKTAVTTEKLAARAVGFVKRHPVGALLFVAVFLLLVIMQSCMSSLATLGNGTAGAVGASTYPAEDADLLGAEAAYSGMEAELQNYLDTYESNPTTMTSTTTIWTRSSMTPMCCCPSSAHGMRGNGRWPRYRTPCKCSLTANTFSPRMWWWRCGIGRKPGRIAKATTTMWKCRTTTIFAP